MLTVKDLSVEEKLRLICGRDNWSTVDFDGKIPSVFVSDGPVGLRTEKNIDGKQVTLPAVAYPAIQVLANTWNAELAYKMGESLADDCIERDVDILLAPGVNIKRTPVCGRNFEYASEDPLVAGTVGKEYINGVQSHGVGTCLKHFCCNNLEWDRFHQSSDVDERTMREIYLKPFEIACEAKPVSVMCAYNRVNGVYAAENKKGFDILRNEFGFDGAIISDWEAVRDRAKSAIAGLDLEMPFCQATYDKLVEDYNDGKITEAQVDACAQRILDLVYNNAEKKKTRKVKTTEDERKELSAEILAEGAVLLKNNGILPLKKKYSVAVCGGYAKPDNIDLIRGGGSAGVTRYDVKYDLVEALKARVDGDVLYEGAFCFGGVNTGRYGQEPRKALKNAAICDVNIVCVGTGARIESEGSDRSIIRLPYVQEHTILETAKQNKNTVVLIFAGSAVDVSPWADKVAAILYVGFPGEKFDDVLADILTGKINPSGKLTETFALDLFDIPSMNTYFGAGVTRYHEGLDVGYRYFDTYDVPVAFPFGFGLSYSEFDYSGLKLKVKGDNGDKLGVSFKIKNKSDFDGKEVAQVYVHPVDPFVYRPKKELKAYAKVLVKASESEEVKLTLDKSAFEYWSIAKDCKTVDDGVYQIMVGSSVADISLEATVEIADGKITVL